MLKFSIVEAHLFRMFGLFTLLEAGLLIVNAIAVLHEERFLAKYGWTDEPQHGFGEPGIKVQILRLIKAVRTVMRGFWPVSLHFVQSNYRGSCL